MKNRKFQTVVLSLFVLFLFSGCGGVQDYAETPYNEELIMQMQEDKPNVAEGNADEEFGWQDDGETEGEATDTSALAKSEPPKKEIDVQENQVVSEPTGKTDSVVKNNNNTVAEVQVTENPEVSEGESAVNTESDTVQKTEQVSEKEQSEAKSTEEKKNICTLSVRCDSILSNMNKLPKEKKPLVPTSGVIYAQTELEFQPGESVFDVLKKEMQKNRIHMEFNETSAYKSAYVEGINNLYEFDCGELSGWVYKVNGKLGNVGCSQYILKPGDMIEWVYTCAMGRDV